MSVLEKLRLATGPLHADLESRLNLVERLADHGARSAIVARFHGLHAAWETSLAPHLSKLEGLDFENRRRSGRLAVDLASLGLDAARITPAPRLSPGGRHEALGFFYVLEGSSLGGKAITKAMMAQGSDMRGLGFLDPYGQAVGERWRDFLAVLDREGRAAFQGAIVRGGIAGFTAARDWLCDPQREAA